MRLILSLHFEEMDVFILRFKVLNFQRMVMLHFLDYANQGRTKDQLKESEWTTMNIQDHSYPYHYLVFLSIFP